MWDGERKNREIKKLFSVLIPSFGFLAREKSISRD